MEQEIPVQPELAFDGNVACTRCGKADETLLLSLHPWVVSTVFEADERIDAGVWCVSCRTSACTMAVTKSLVVGWWSFSGPAATVRAVRRNLAGGDYDRADNAEMHRTISKFREANGEFDRAARHGMVAQSLKADTEFGRDLYALKKRANFRGEPAKPASSFQPYLPIVVMALLAVVILGLAIPRLMKDDEPVIQASALPAVERSGGAPPFTPARKQLKMQTTVYGGGPDAQADAIAKAIAELPVEQRRDRAREYTKLRLQSIGADFSKRIPRGEGILDIETRIRDLGDDDISGPVVAEERHAKPYADLLEVMSNATRDYRAGATTEDLKRTARDLSLAGNSNLVHAVREQRRVGSQEANTIVMNWIGSDLVVLEIIIRELVLADVNDAIGRLQSSL